MRHNAIANFSKYCTTPWKTICTELGLIVKIKGVIENSITLTLPDQPKPAPLLFYCLTPDDFTCQGRASGWERVNTDQLLLEWLLNNVREVVGYMFTKLTK